MSKFKQGESHPMYKHGMYNTVQYKKWCGMMRRCYNKNDKSYVRYGKQGISAIKRWHNFINFWDDMKESYFNGAEIDRRDNNKGYSKTNCRWVTKIQQANNKSNVKLYTFNGKSLSAAQWGRETGLRPAMIRARMRDYKWSIQKALTTPCRVKKHRTNIKKHKRWLATVLEVG